MYRRQPGACRGFRTGCVDMSGSGLSLVGVSVVGVSSFCLRTAVCSNTELAWRAGDLYRSDQRYLLCTSLADDGGRYVYLLVWTKGKRSDMIDLVRPKGKLVQRLVVESTVSS